ncbi:S8 family peptidase [Aliterella atlantica]|uniref:Serine protease n=1 Tax=Aliterella atlantica CENA595 TaxID=1618023 RepID=A0A0D8ZWZ7_9CYAN|nr:serine protease [Aliterella atlantica CENA595]
MRRFLLLCLFIVGISFALFNFNGLANKGNFDSIVLDFREDIPAAKVSQEINAIATKFSNTPQLNSVFSVSDRLYVVKGDRNTLKSLKKSKFAKETEYIEPNYIYTALEAPNDPDYGKQWNLRSINVEAAWNETKGKDVTVAVIDTGVSPVPDLKDTTFVKGYDFVNDKVEADDDNGHGTHVAGTVAQSTNNNYGVAGIAYEASIMPLKVLSAYGGGTVADIAESIRFAADNGADVINMSLGGGGESQVMKDAIDYAHNKGVVIIAAAGNESQNSASYPARYQHVIGVAAIDAAGEKAPYSNFGAGVDISAPGGSQAGLILQDTIDPETGVAEIRGFQGTSMASPHVAGVAALIRASGVTQPDEVLAVLQKSARVIKDDNLNYFGSGHLDAAAAVLTAQKGQISFQDFFRWLRQNGYLNLRFWFDGGAIALLPKLAMVLGSYLLAWFLRVYFPFTWTWSLASGLVAGSSGLFFLRGFYIFDLPQWPFRLLGSSIPELGNALQGNNILNPVFASVLIPFVLIALFLGHPSWKWFAVGSSLGVASCLLVSAVVTPDIWWLGEGLVARSFLIGNALLCYGLAWLAMKGETQTA